MSHALLLALGSTLIAAAPAARAEPRLLDSIGYLETDARAYVVRGDTWVPEVSFFFEFDGWAQEDVVLIEWRDGQKTIGKPFACSAARFVREVQSNPTTPVLPANIGRFQCRFPDDDGISKAGTFQLRLTYKQTLAGKTYELGNLTMKVVEIHQGSANKPNTTYADDRDHQLGIATIEEYTGGPNGADEQLQSAVEKHLRVQGDGHELLIRFWTKHDDKGPRTMTMACLQGDQKVAEAQSVGGGLTSSYWTFEGKDRRHVRYAQQALRFYNMRGGKGADPAQFYLGDHPGDYRCVAMAGGEVLKEIFFSVGADGEIQRTGCDDEARLLRHVHILPATDRAIANVPYDAEAARRGAFFGRVSWKTGCAPK